MVKISKCCAMKHTVTSTHTTNDFIRDLYFVSEHETPFDLDAALIYRFLPHIQLHEIIISDFQKIINSSLDPEMCKRNHAIETVPKLFPLAVSN